MTVKRRKDNSGRVLKDGEYQRKNGTYEFKWIDELGKRRSLYAPTLSKLREKQKGILKNSLDGLRVDGSKLSVRDLFYVWAENKRGVKERTEQLYYYLFTNYIDDVIGDAKVVKLKNSDVRSYYNYLFDNRGLKISTIDNIHTVLHQLLDVACEDGYIQKNPSDKAMTELKRIRNQSQKKKKILTVEEQKLLQRYLLTEPKYEKWRSIFIVMLWTGLRIGEVTALTWSDIDFDNNEILIKRSLAYYDRPSLKSNNGATFAISTPKSQAGYRKIPMTENVKLAFEHEREFQLKCGLKCKVEIDGVTDFVFLNREGSVQHQGTINRALKRIVRDINEEQIENNQEVLLPNISSHSFRHTFTTRMIEAGANVKATQVILGHSDPSLTLGTYARATKEFKKLEINKIFEIME